MAGSRNNDVLAATPGILDGASDATLLLRAAGGDVCSAADRFPAVYAELRRLAEVQFAGEGAGHTLQPTALVNEAWLRLLDERGEKWTNPAYFFAAAAEAMRRILIEHARRRGRKVRGGGLARLALDGVDAASDADEPDWDGFDEALTALGVQDARAAQVVRLRVYAGLGVHGTAEALGVSPATVKREWSYARAWLRDRLGEG